MTLPTIPPLPVQPAPTLDQQLTHAGLLLRVAEYQQRERSIAATQALETAQKRMVAAQEATILEIRRSGDLMERYLNGEGSAPSAPPASAEGLTAGDVQIVKGLAEAIRPQAAPQP